MAYPISETKFDLRAQLINANIQQLAQYAPSWKAKALAGFDMHWVIMETLPRVNAQGGALALLADPAGYSQAVLDKIELFATQGMATPPADFWAEYNGVRSALLTFAQLVRQTALDNLSDAFSVSAAGVVTWKPLPADPALANAAQAITDAIS